MIERLIQLTEKAAGIFLAAITALTFEIRMKLISRLLEKRVPVAGQWPDSGLGCPQEGEALAPGPVEGLVISLKHAGRVYTYHTDRKAVRPCPAIETE